MTEGLSAAEAARRLREFGPNRLAAGERRARILELLEMFADPMALMLLAAGGVYLALGEVRDGVVLLVALLPVLGVDVFLELRSREALRKLSQALAPRARVIRDGRELDVPSESLVPGDVALLREGDVLPADGVVRFSANLALDESQLTGEAEPIDKPAEAPFYAGSLVLAGHARGEITATGARTRYAAIAALVATGGEGQSPLQRKTSRVVRMLGVVALGVAVLVLALGLLRGMPLGRALVAAIGVAMAAIPEEFPLVFTLFLALGAFRLSSRGVLVRRLASVETLGSTTVVCVDKTGTLTRGSFALETLLPLGGASEDELLETAALASELEPADPMERAILERAGSQPLHWQLVEDYPFEPAGKHMTHLWRRGADYRVAAKGALEGILEHCTGADREEALAANERLAGAGMRVLAVAGRSAPAPGGDRVADEADLKLLGLLGFRDPLRPEVPAAVAECLAAGIAVKMITGDHALTARAIAAAAGLPHEAVLTGDQLDAIPPEELPDALRRTSVLARVRPEQKYAVVEALLSTGEVVAMTGDGINDAPALRRADIGVAMGQRGTAVARAAADLVLLHDDFGALVATIREGRRIFANLQRAFLYLVAFHIPIVGLAVLPPLLGMPMLLLPVHLVWLELLVHPISALVFEGEPAPKGSMSRPPRDPKAPLLPRPLLVRSAVSGALVTLFALALFAWRLRDGETAARSLAVTTVIAGSLLLVFAERAMDTGWREAGLPRERRFWLVWTLSAATLPAALWFAPAAQILRIQPLSLGDFALATGAAALAVVWRAPARSLK